MKRRLASVFLDQICKHERITRNSRQKYLSVKTGIKEYVVIFQYEIIHLGVKIIFPNGKEMTVKSHSYARKVTTPILKFVDDFVKENKHKYK